MILALLLMVARAGLGADTGNPGADAEKAPESSAGNPILDVKLTPQSLPKNVKITNEVWASAKQLLDVRSKVGFPIMSFLSQSMIYENDQAQMNYLLLPNEDWLAYGYSKLVQNSRDRSFILTKENVIIEVVATRKELEAQLARILKADPVHYAKIRAGVLPQDWLILQERYLASNEVAELVHEFGIPMKGVIVQELMAGHSKLKVRYYSCGTSRAAEALVSRLSSEEKPLFTKMVLSSGVVVVMAESQSDELNSRIMSLVNW